MLGIRLRKIKYKMQDYLKNEKIRFILYSTFALFFIFIIAGLLISYKSNSFKKEITNNIAGETEEEYKVGLSDTESFLKKYQTSKINSLPKTNTFSSSIVDILNTDSLNTLLPARNWQVQFKDINATSALAVYMPEKRILYGRNVFEQRPVASLTKLMTALVVLDTYNSEEIITISQEAIKEEGDSANFVAGEQFTVNQLLYALLLESSNDAAWAFLEQYNKDNSGKTFINAMNQKAQDMGLANTTFADPAGLSDANVSTAHEISQILYLVFQNDILKQVMQEPSYTTKSINKSLSHFWVNLNSLLGAQEDVLVGKTGFTNEAGPSMSTVAKSPIENTFVVTVVLDAQDRIEATRELLEWVKKAYIWE